jgi:hypothetical protein
MCKCSSVANQAVRQCTTAKITWRDTVERNTQIPDQSSVLNQRLPHALMMTRRPRSTVISIHASLHSVPRPILTASQERIRSTLSERIVLSRLLVLGSFLNEVFA